MIVPSSDLIPAPWRQASVDAALRIYNPAIVSFRGRLLMAYRLDFNRRNASQRRIGICALDAHLNVIAETVVPLSNTICSGGAYHYDPRFLVYGNRLFVHYNNNFQTRPNQIFLVELDPDTLEAKAPARPLQLAGPRQEIEKNWMFFEHEGDVLAVYQVAPHTILRANLTGSGPIQCEKIEEIPWDVSGYAGRFGMPRGGAPPVRMGDVYISFFHSRYPISRLHWVLRYWPIASEAVLPHYAAAIERRLRRPFARVRYYGGAYTFEARPPFRPRWLTAEPLLNPAAERPRQHRRRANPSAEGIVYPCGAIPWHDGSWLVSYGVHDERCCLRCIHLPIDHERPGRSES